MHTIPLSFPTSPLRDRPHIPIHHFPISHPIPVLNTPDTSPPPPLTIYPTHVPRLREVAPGILSDGSLTTNHPAVRRFLEAASTADSATPTPTPTSPAIFVLAALALFYHPKRPAHWLFWSRDKRHKTANIVHSVLNIKPQPVKSPISWLGISENLSIVANLQFGWKEHLITLPWYTQYVESKSPASRTRMNLRKRKQQQQQNPSSSLPQLHTQAHAPTDPAEDEDPDTHLGTPPPKKRPRTTRSSHTAAQVAVGILPNDASGDHEPDPDEELETPHKDHSLSPSHSTSQLPTHDPAEDTPVRRKSLRQQGRKAQGSSSDEPTTTVAIRPRSSSRAESASECSTAVSVCRVRSGSSASTSQSDLSGTTAVDKTTEGLKASPGPDDGLEKQGVRRKAGTGSTSVPGFRVSARIGARESAQTSVPTKTTTGATDAATTTKVGDVPEGQKAATRRPAAPRSRKRKR